jgi:hypothetical protein
VGLAVVVVVEEPVVAGAVVVLLEGSGSFVAALLPSMDDFLEAL